MQTAWTILTDVAVKAILLIAQDKQIELDNAKVAAALSEIMKEMIPTIQQEWAEAIEANLGKAWLERLLNAQAYEIAIEVLKKMEVL